MDLAKGFWLRLNIRVIEEYALINLVLIPQSQEAAGTALG